MNLTWDFKLNYITEIITIYIKNWLFYWINKKLRKKGNLSKIYYKKGSKNSIKIEI